MARSIADLRLAFDALTAPEPCDPWFTPIASQPPAPRRVAVVRDPGGSGLHASVPSMLERTADALAGEGYEVEELHDVPFREAAEIWTEVMSVEMAGVLAQMAPMLAPDTLTFMQNAVAGLPAPSLELYHDALTRRHAILGRWCSILETYPVILAPISTMPPFAADFDQRPEAPRVMLEAFTPTVAVNAMGLPATAVPVFDNDGKPGAVQLIGGRFREGLCLEAAEAIERRLGGAQVIDPR
jgi:amidase